MNIKQLEVMQDKLHKAQMLLSDVYAYACDEGIDNVGSQMSCADSCIIESMEFLEQLEAQEIDDASWRA
jgi:hypothetical protein